MLRGLVYFIYHHLAGVEFEVNNYLKRLITHAWIGLILVASALNISLHAQTVGGGTIEDPAIGPPPAYNYGSDTTGYVLIKNWDFGANGTISGNADLTTHFQFHDQFGLYANGGGYGSVIMAPDQASAIGSQPVEDPANPIREYLTDSMKTYLQPLNGAMIVDPNLRNTANGSFQAKWVLPNGGALLGKDMIWETRVRYVTPPYFWFAIWTSGNLWSSGAEMDLIESFGYDNGGGYTNYDGRYWHSSVVGGTQETNYHAHWGNAMASYGITNYDATQWHTWTWVYHADNTFTSYVDGIVVQRGSTYWTYGATETGQPINMSFIFDGAWGHQAVSSVNHTLAASELVGKYYEWDYSRVYLRDPSRIDFDGYSFTSYGSGQDQSGGVTVQNNGYSLNFTGNTWKKISFPYTVSANSMLEFDVSGLDMGEIVAIGFDSDQTFDSKQFQIGGSDPNSSFTQLAYCSAGSGTSHYSIPVGTYYTGSMNYLVFIIDDDANASSNVTFSNVDVYENTSILDLSGYSFTSYQGTSAGQDVTGTVTVVGGGTGVQITGNSWKKISLPYTVTANTVLEFDIIGSDTGEILAIGFDNDQTFDAKQFQIGGSDGNSTLTQQSYYTAGSGASHYTINVGSYYTGSMSYLVFIADDDANASSNVTFSNIEIHE